MLKGLRVVELATHVAAPAAAGMMADWGALVVKVEKPEGDPMRAVRQDLLPDGALNPAFEMDNRGKRSIVLNINMSEGRDALIRLLRGADVFITNMRSRALRKARLDWETVRAENRD